MSEYLLEVAKLRLVRDGKRILNGVDLHMRPGEVHGLLGLNGSGKSTLAYTLMGCSGYKPDGGRILFAGQDITGMSIVERARLGLTLAWQEPARFEGLPVGAYLALAARDGNPKQLAAALEAVALPPTAYLKRAVNHALSGGERKRIELAAVYMMKPRLAILDEPDSGVDALTLGDIAELIRKMSNQGTAVLLITHRDEMLEAADAASLMCQGSIISRGDPDHVREFYGGRCRPHGDRMGDQPWQVDARVSTTEQERAL